MKEFELERKVLDGVGSGLPAGWKITEAPAASGFDAVATSPRGNIFPIEIRGGEGDLDVSTVVRFGSTVRSSAGSGKLGDFLGTRGSIPDQGDKVGVKPLIVTSRKLPPATSDYASRLNIEVVAAEKSVPAGKTGSAHSEIGRLNARLIDHLKNWDARIQEGKGVASHLAQSQGLENWYKIDTRKK